MKHEQGSLPLRAVVRQPVRVVLNPLDFAKHSDMNVWLISVGGTHAFWSAVPQLSSLMVRFSSYEKDFLFSRFIVNVVHLLCSSISEVSSTAKVGFVSSSCLVLYLDLELFPQLTWIRRAAGSANSPFLAPFLAEKYRVGWKF